MTQSTVLKGRRKPRLRKTRCAPRQWVCFLMPVDYYKTVLGLGPTPEAAYQDWRNRMAE